VAFLDNGNLRIELYQPAGKERTEVASRTDGHIDHLALDVLDMDSALKDALNRGARLHPATAQGPVSLPTFGPKGVRYAILEGPSGEKVEFTRRMDSASGRKENMSGWSHLGIPVTDLERSKFFYERFGFKQTLHAEIPQDSECIRAVMMEKDGFTIELYQLTSKDIPEIRSRKDGRIDHIALDVADAEKAFQELKAAGLEPLESAPVTLPFWENGVTYFNVRGPDGEKVEFIQRL
jgi:lactoylglutathione lyase